ncbi:hypothetical protein OSTOST_02889 [Ostertagia ostertagi]
MRKDHEAKDSKLYFITKKDLWNIMVKYKLMPGMRDRDDLTSLGKRRDEQNPEDGIRYLKMPDEPTGKGFVLVVITPIQQKWLELYGHKGISVDDTHNVTRYALKLASVMVVDERDRGLPAAFLLSGEMTSREVKILFDEIKRIVPNFAPKSLVTDEALAFYNGFKSSFPNVNVDHFLCRFHILQTWKRKTKECVKANTHCSRCQVCPYAVTCSCRAGALAGVACSHSHAVKLYGIKLPICQYKSHCRSNSLHLGAQPVVEPPVQLTLQTEPQEVEIQYCGRELRPTRDVRGDLHAMRDEVAKIYALINAKVNALVRRGDESSLETLSGIVERMRSVADGIEVPTEPTILLARPDVPLTGGRPRLQKAEMYTRAQVRKQTRKPVDKSAEHVWVDPEEILVCSLLCYEEDPVLPEDMDPEEQTPSHNNDAMYPSCLLDNVCVRAIHYIMRMFYLANLMFDKRINASPSSMFKGKLYLVSRSHEYQDLRWFTIQKCRDLN